MPPPTVGTSRADVPGLLHTQVTIVPEDGCGATTSAGWGWCGMPRGMLSVEEEPVRRPSWGPGRSKNKKKKNFFFASWVGFVSVFGLSGVGGGWVGSVWVWFGFGLGLGWVWVWGHSVLLRRACLVFRTMRPAASSLGSSFGSTRGYGKLGPSSEERTRSSPPSPFYGWHVVGTLPA